MTFIKDLTKWLAGDGSKNEPDVSPIIKIKVLNKRLARQVSKMEAQAKIIKQKAIKARQEGMNDTAKLHMKNSLQYLKWAHSTEHFRIKIDNLQMRLEQAKILGDFSNIAENLGDAIQGLQLNVKAPKVKEAISQLGVGLGEADGILSDTVKSLEYSEGSTPESEVSDSEVDAALEALDTEMMVKEGGLELPEVPVVIDNPEKELENLEDEIENLKKEHKIT